MVEQKRLQRATLGFLGEIRQEMRCEDFRCHEYARLLAGKIAAEFGVQILVRDGIVVYNEKFLKDYLFKEEKAGSSDPAELPALLNSIRSDVFNRMKEKRIFTQHSWCEIGGNTIVDFHASLYVENAGGSVGLDDFLLIGTRSELADRASYIPCVRRISLGKIKFLVLPNLFPWRGWVRLRV